MKSGHRILVQCSQETIRIDLRFREDDYVYAVLFRQIRNHFAQ